MDYLVSAKGPTIFVSNGNNIVACKCNFACFAANDIKGRQVATGKGASYPQQQHSQTLKPGHQTFVTPYSAETSSNLGVVFTVVALCKEDGQACNLDHIQTLIHSRD